MDDMPVVYPIGIINDTHMAALWPTPACSSLIVGY
jgi:hypothetical protein